MTRIYKISKPSYLFLWLLILCAPFSVFVWANISAFGIKDKESIGSIALFGFAILGLIELGYWSRPEKVIVDLNSLTSVQGFVKSFMKNSSVAGYARQEGGLFLLLDKTGKILLRVENEAEAVEFCNWVKNSFPEVSNKFAKISPNDDNLSLELKKTNTRSLFYSELISCVFEVLVPFICVYSAYKVFQQPLDLISVFGWIELVCYLMLAMIWIYGMWKFLTETLKLSRRLNQPLAETWLEALQTFGIRLSPAWYAPMHQDSKILIMVFGAPVILIISARRYFGL